MPQLNGVFLRVPVGIGAQLCRLSPVDTHTFYSEISSREDRHGPIHDVVLWHFAMCTCVNCLTYILGMMLNCIRTE